METSGSGNSGVSQTMYVPVYILCCPNIIKNEPCYCGHTPFVTMPQDFQLQ